MNKEEFKKVFGFESTGVVPALENQLVYAKLVELAKPFHIANSELEQIRQTYANSKHGNALADMLAHQNRATELKVAQDKAGEEWANAHKIATEAGFGLKNDILIFKPAETQPVPLKQAS